VQAELAEKFPASLWQRDCFAASFGQDSEKVQLLCHMFSCTVMSKCTARLQLTDTDLSHKFKARVRIRMEERREVSETALREAGSADAWEPNAEDLVWATVMAQEDMMEAQENERSEWVLSGLRRNFMLPYRPYPEGLRPVGDEAWASDKPQGNSRIPASWCIDRMAWAPNAVPVAPEFRLSDTAKEVADLLEWDYANADKKDGSDEPVLSVEKMAEELSIEVDMARSLQLPPDLRNSLALRAKDSRWQEEKKKRLKRKRARKAATETRKFISEASRQAINTLLSTSSRSVLIKQTIHPKSSVKTRTGAYKKKKMSQKKLKGHHGGAGKQAEQLAKQAVKKTMMVAVAKAEAKAKTKAKAKAKATAEAPDSEALPSVASLWLGKTLRVIDEQAGQHKYGIEGNCIKQNLAKNEITLSYTVHGNPLETTISLSLVAEAGSLKKATTFRKQHITRLERKDILVNLRLWTSEAEDEEMASYEAVTSDWITDQIMAACIELLKWNFSQHAMPKYIIIDPALAMRLHTSLASVEPSDVAYSKVLTEAVLSAMQGCKRVIVPIFGGNQMHGHWTLLVIDKTESGDISQIRYRDSLTVLHISCRSTAETFLRVMSPEAKLPLRTNSAFQPAGGLCGWYVAAWIETELSELNGEGWASREWPALAAATLYKRMITFHNSNKTELDSIAKDAIKEKALSDKVFDDLQKRAHKAATSDFAKKYLLDLALEAKTNLLGPEWMQHLTVKDLSLEVQEKLMQIHNSNMIVCSKCRFKSGCKDWFMVNLKL
jgi:hypothetical protein